MKQTIFFKLILILIIGCPTNTEKNQTEIATETQGKNFIERLDSISAQELEELIKMPIRNKFNEKYSGYYSYITNEQGQNVLNGNFEFVHFGSSALYDPITKEYDTAWGSVSEIEYYGTFEKGVKNGTIKKSNYRSLEEMNNDLMRFLVHYNLYRRHGSLRRELRVKTPFDAVEKWFELDENIFKQKPEEFKNKVLPLQRKQVVKHQQPCET